MKKVESGHVGPKIASYEEELECLERIQEELPSDKRVLSLLLQFIAGRVNEKNSENLARTYKTLKNLDLLETVAGLINETILDTDQKVNLDGQVLISGYNIPLEKITPLFSKL